MAPDMPAGTFAVTPGPINASVDYFRITIRGKSAHVSTPQKGADALYAACQIVNALQGLVTRRTSPVDTVIIGVGKLEAGTAYNIVAEQAVLEGTLRTYRQELREELKDRIGELAARLAALWGTEGETHWEDFASVLRNDPLVSREAAEVAAGLVGKENVETNRPPSLGGDDFAEFLLFVPGVYVNVGCALPGRPAIPLHNCRFDLDEDALVYGAGLYAGYAAFYLGSP
jgi:amidohydrolase